MANPRQRRKARSSVGTNRPSKRSLKNKRKVAMSIASWDKTKTVRQNYAALGLLHKLDPRQAGGVESSLRPPSARSRSSAPAPDTAGVQPGPDDIPAGYARLIRDADGNVIDVVFGPDADAPPIASTSTSTPWGPTMEAWGSEDEDDDEAAVDVDAASDDDEEAPIQGIAVAPVARIRRGKPVPAKTDFAQELEARAIAAAEVPSAPRWVSDGERDFLVELYRAHGTDEERMTRDRKRNIYQRTAGEIRKSIKRAGGWEAVAREVEAA